MPAPAALDEFGLIPAIDSHMKSFGRRQEIVTELSHEGMESRLAPDTEAAAYRIPAFAGMTDGGSDKRSLDVAV